MKFDLERSIIYDTIRCFDIYFNYEEIKQNALDYELDEETMFYLYERVIEQIKVEQDINAFFYLDKNSITFFTDILLQNLYEINCLDEFFELLDREIILQLFSQFYFNKVAEVSVDEIYGLNVNGNVKTSIRLIFADYENIKHILMKNINSMYEVVKDVYCKLQINDFESWSKVGLKAVLSIDEIIEILMKNKCYVEEDNIIYGISIFHPYMYKGRLKDSNWIWIFGSFCEEYLQKEELFCDTVYSNIGEILSNKQAIDILEIIHKNEKVTISDIYKLLPSGISDSTAYRTVIKLLANRVIYISDRQKNRIYYSVNNVYFDNVSILLNKFINQYRRKEFYYEKMEKTTIRNITL